MSDIVERLLDRTNDDWAIRAEAAAEIERLQAERDSAWGRIKELRAEIERLTAALRTNNYHLAKLVNGTDDDDPATWEAAKNQVLATRRALEQKP